MLILQLSIFIENRKGRLADITALLGKHNINIKAMCIADTANFGILRIITDNTPEVEKLLRSHQITVSVTSVIGIAVPDKPGGLAAALALLAANDIAVEYMYGFMSGANENAYIVIRADNSEKAVEILRQNGYTGVE